MKSCIIIFYRKQRIFPQTKNVPVFQQKSINLSYIRFSMGTSSDDSSLIKDCISGKREAWDLFVSRFSKLIYHSINKARSYAPKLDQEDMEDIYSSVFLSFLEDDYRRLRQFKGKKGCTLSSWVRLITIRHTIDFLRKQKHHIPIDNKNETLKDNKPSAQDYIELSETEEMLKKAIEALPPLDRLFMELYYTKELPPEEIADIMNISVSTVYSKKTRIRNKMEKILIKKGFIA